MQSSLKIYTIGHSNHELEYFLNLLKRADISAIADVRSSPYSRFTPHFSRKELEIALKQEKIAYVFLGDELGARTKDRSCYIDGQASYERIAKLESFQVGIQRVLEGAQKYNIALMCAEKEPLDCHRTLLVARVLKEKGAQIAHILANGTLEDSSVTDKRLLLMTGKETNDFFSDSLQQAYEVRSKQIAYREEKEPELATA
jgi:uncharacterized protein (DUF488 family)